MPQILAVFFRSLSTSRALVVIFTWCPMPMTCSSSDCSSSWRFGLSSTLKSKSICLFLLMDLSEKAWKNRENNDSIKSPSPLWRHRYTAYSDRYRPFWGCCRDCSFSAFVVHYHKTPERSVCQQSIFEKKKRPFRGLMIKKWDVYLCFAQRRIYTPGHLRCATLF